MGITSFSAFQSMSIGAFVQCQNSKTHTSMTKLATQRKPVRQANSSRYNILLKLFMI